MANPLILELNDSGLRLHAADGELLDSPGYITIDQRHNYLGNESFERCKLMPTRTEYSFWEQLSLDKLTRSYAIAKTHADLAYLHLESIAAEIADGTPIWLAVSADRDRDQLGLILGMCKRLNLNVQALVDLGLAACPAPAPGRQLYHLDVHLHRCVLTHYEQGPWLEAKQHWVSGELGVVRLQDTWAHAVSQMFVRHSRFDPMHQAEVEQRLYDQINHWDQALASDNTASIELEYGGRRYQSKLTRDAMIEAAEPIYRRLFTFAAKHIDESQASRILLSDRAAALPGLMEKLEQLPRTELQVLSRDAVAKGTQRIYLQRQGDASGVSYVRKKPWFSAENLKQHDEEIASQDTRQPTHVLYQSVAYPLTEQRFLIAGQVGANDSGLSLGDLAADLGQQQVILSRSDGRLQLTETGGDQVWVNNQQAKLGQNVQLGDRLRVGAQGSEIMLIAVNTDGA